MHALLTRSVDGDKKELHERMQVKQLGVKAFITGEGQLPILFFAM